MRWSALFKSSLLCTCIVLPLAACRHSGSLSLSGGEGWGEGVLRDKLRVPDTGTDRPRTSFVVRGVVRELKPDGRTVVIQHEAITNFMAAMTMPFRARQTNELSGLQPGDEIRFVLWVTEEASWIEGITRTGRAAVSNRFSAGLAPATNENIRSQPSPTQAAAVPTNGAAAFRLNQIPDFALTNELGQPIRLGDFEGRALAMTFFFTRCPIPEYCPRLTRNFSGAIQRLKALPDGPTNYHFLSVSFDPVDSPLLLRAYAQQYRYDSNHWSFVTGKPEDVHELAEGFGVPIIPSTGSGRAPALQSATCFGPGCVLPLLCPC